MTIDYIRSFRVGEYAIFDFVASLILMVILAPFLSWIFRKIHIVIPLRSWLLWAVPLGMLVHLVFGAMTPMTKALIDPQGYWILKVLMLALVISGFIGIKYE